MKLKLKFKARPAAPTMDEAARWRSTSFSTELTQETLDKLISKYGEDALGVHYDDGVPTGKETGMGGGVRSRESTTPQTSFNPKAKWETPVGIYYYPMVWAKDRVMKGSIPFAGDKKFIYIYRIRDLSKRIDVSDAPYNGFLERALLWAAKNADLPKVLNNSGVPSDAYYEILKLYGGGVLFSDPSLSPKENIKRIIKDYMKKDRFAVYKWTRETVGKGGSPEDRYKIFINYYNSAVNQYAGRDLPSDDPKLPVWVMAKALWAEALDEMLDEMGWKKFYMSIVSTDSPITPSNRLETVESNTQMQELVDAYDYKIKLEPPFTRRKKETKADKPLPPGTVAKLFSNVDAKGIANMTFYIVNNMMDRNVARVTKYYISEGYEVLEDKNGTGTIHPSESTQGVYLTTGIVELVGSYLNLYRAGRGKGTDIPQKQINPRFLRANLSSEKGSIFVDKALELSRTDPDSLHQSLLAIHNNASINKDKKLADKILKANLSQTYTTTLGYYIQDFASALSLDEMEDAVTTFLDAGVRDNLQQVVADNTSLFIDSIGTALDEAELVYGSGLEDNYNNYPNLALLKGLVSQSKALGRVDEILTNSTLYKATAAIKIFPKYLETPLKDGGKIPLETAAVNFLESFRPKKFEDRKQFVEWIFDTYPQLLEDKSSVVYGLKNLKFWSELDTDENEQEMNDSDIYKKLTATKVELDAEKEASQKKVAESRFKKLNRIGRWSMLR
jgi:hypothetical protein